MIYCTFVPPNMTTIDKNDPLKSFIVHWRNTGKVNPSIGNTEVNTWNFKRYSTCRIKLYTIH